MGFMKRVFGGGEQPAESGPDWAGPMSAEEAARLVAAVEEELTRRGYAYEHPEGGLVRVQRPAGPMDYGLSNLAQLCHQLSDAEWQPAVAGHFDGLFAAEEGADELDRTAADFEAVRSMLKVRLFPGPGLGGPHPQPPVSWEFAPGITAAFVFDLPTTVATVNREHVAAWTQTRDELVSIALDNVRGDAAEEQRIEDDGGASPAMALVADHFFVASHALLLDERLPAGAQGAVFAVPHRHALLYAPVVDLGIVQSINRLIVTGVSLFQQGPGSISPGLYWWNKGSVTLLPSQFDGRKVDFAPPEEFVAVLNGLQPPA
jgi:hypothetical protein